MPNGSRGRLRKACQVSGVEPTVGAQCGQVAQLLGGLQQSWAAKSWAEKLGRPEKVGQLELKSPGSGGLILDVAGRQETFKNGGKRRCAS